MKKLVITCALISLGSMVSVAQSAKKTHSAPNTNAAAGQTQSVAGTKSAEKRAKQMQNDLKLDATQYKGVLAALVEYDKQEQAAKANGAVGEGTAMQLKMMLDQKFKEAMSPAQYTKYEKTKDASKNKAQ
jgi:hypothetical protein